MKAETGRTDGVDTVRYQSAAGGITVSVGGTTSPTVTVQDGDGGTDTLHSIERIEGSAHADTLVITNLTSDIGAAFDWIDLGGGADTVDVSALSGSVTVDLQDLNNQTVTFGSAVLTLRNVENVTTGGGDDIVYYPATGAGSTVSAGDGNDTFYLAGSGHTVLAGGGYDVLNLSSVVTGSRIDMGSGSALIRDSGSSSFDSIEEIIGGAGNDIMYGDGSGTTLIAGGGVNYLEGSGSDILVGGTGDTYFAVSNGGTVISGAGNDYIEVTGAAPVTIKFGVGSGHDMLGSYFSTDRDNSWVDDRQHDLIVLEGLTRDDIELVWNFTETGYVQYQHPTDPTVVTNDWHQRIGEAAIRIKSTGETLYLGELSYFYSYTGASFFLTTNVTSESGGAPGDRTISYDWERAYEQALENEVFNQTYDWTRNTWSTPEDQTPGSDIPANNNSDWWDGTVDFTIFSFDGVTKLDLFDLFDLENIVSQPLSAEVTAAEDLLARLGSGGDSGLIGGTSGADNLTGTGADDDILGGAGDDVLDGGGGDDYLRGGDGNDNLSGGSGTDILYGGAAHDTLDGGAGNDVLNGGAGNDVYFVDSLGDTINEASGEGMDTVNASVSWTLGANLENLALAGVADIDGTGNDLANLLRGNSGANTLSGRGGNDRLYGYGGNDTLQGDAGDDLLYGNNGDDSLDGGAGGDTLTGGFGNDTLDGGSGRDAFYGGAGADMFVFRDGDFAGLTAATADQIGDFSQPEGDLIDLSLVDASSLVAGDQAFAFIGTGAFTGTAGELRYDIVDGHTYVSGDTDGDGIADFMIHVAGTHALTESDFVI